MYGITEDQMLQEQAPLRKCLKDFMRLATVPELEVPEIPWAHLKACPGEQDIVWQFEESPNSQIFHDLPEHVGREMQREIARWTVASTEWRVKLAQCQSKGHPLKYSNKT